MDKKITLNNGIEMPTLGFGVFQIPDYDECKRAVLQALKNGYHLIDTAAAYLNEGAVGDAIRESGINREEIFVTTKLWVQDAGYENTQKAIDASLKRLGLDYIDLYLIHQPLGDVYGSWRAMEDAYKTGKLKSIGVANFENDRLQDLMMHNEIKPAVDQIELHPFFAQPERVQWLLDNDIVPEAWGPFAEGKQGIFTNPTIKKIADNHGKTNGQVILRWLNQRNIVVIPKSVHESRIIENSQIFDFELSAKEMEQMNSLDEGVSLFGNMSNPETVKQLGNVKFNY
ncbi:aldo/keto reductase [Companilactobacillus bobalius]|uniref:Glyoxal reductase n=2 Tax=Companilactobacillus bobalius TaxID=2801451 RepID=A0A202FFG0_9LACO|nr:aldo/keto reductase [Companilactobacillus bobalius]KAE9560385.1 2,5-diketo-D-gluconic acid reductase [Companilactobacillus bobalius]KRK83133.1 2,5 diketo-d-gluconic acid-like reductase, nadp dependent, (promiscuous) [Companilactobacillus bobalius DSM 19674]OVE99178.1 Glyoxal reductase [Companilactobacillus bobalius]GEO57154.1 2,5-diketo-D-gluconic acid reductase [Companilactobacillus paralimentarius]